MTTRKPTKKPTAKKPAKAPTKKATAKKATPSKGAAKKATPSKGAAKKASKTQPAKPKINIMQTVYVIVRELDGETQSYTEPDIVFASKEAAEEHAEKLNREMRTYANPFEFCHPRYAVVGGEAAFIKFLKKHKYPLPTQHTQYRYYEWPDWWRTSYFAMTAEQREAVWDALTKFNWHKVRTTTIE